jgi:hypothetical protein
MDIASRRGGKSCLVAKDLGTVAAGRLKSLVNATPSGFFHVSEEES